MDPYEILGVEKDATDAAIKSAYRKLARKAHPDNGGNAAAFIEINRAYTVLSDPEQRTLFDASGVIVEDDVFNDQQLVLTTLAMYLEHVLGDGAQRGQSPNERNIVKIMRKMLEDRIYEMDSTARGLKIKRDEYRKLINRIKRKGEGENKFAIIINQTMDDVTKQLPGLEKEIRIAKRALDDLMQYESIVDVVRTAQASTTIGETGRFSIYFTT